VGAFLVERAVRLIYLYSIIQFNLFISIIQFNLLILRFIIVSVVL